MLRGIEVGDIMNTAKESVLLQTLQHEENMDYLKTILNYKSAILDKTNSDEVSKLKEILNKYEELRDPKILKDRDDSVKKHSEKLKSLENLNIGEALKNSKKKDMSSLLSFTKSKESGEIKII